jgi:uncharacterized protein YejL (UPF0352 family)
MRKAVVKLSVMVLAGSACVMEKVKTPHDLAIIPLPKVFEKLINRDDRPY